MSGDNKLTELLPTLAELYGAAYDFVRLRHPETYPPWDTRYIERPESAGHVYKKVSDADQQSLVPLQEVLRTGDKSSITKAREDETVRQLREALDKEKNGSKATQKRVRS